MILQLIRHGKAIAIGRNYVEHAKELGNAVPQAPLFFIKPNSSYSFNQPVHLPPNTKSLHHEVELAVVLAQDITAQQSLEKCRNAILGYAVAIDITDRQEQATAKEKGLPWTSAKCLDGFTPIGPFIPKDNIADPQNLQLWLNVNGETKQDGNTRDMIFPIDVLLSYISHRITLYKGDIILTGTPAGVGPVEAGDVIKCGIMGFKESEFQVTVEGSWFGKDKIPSIQDLMEQRKNLE
jgi:acylpyruvate hydrolase